MTNPQRFINRVLVFLLLVLVVTGALYAVIWSAFVHNPALNGLIFTALLFGIGYNLHRIWRLKPEVQWIEMYRSGQPGLSMQDPPRLIGPVALVLGGRERRGRGAPLSAFSLRHFLDSVGTRMDESRDIARYFTGLLIFLGLLGTFWGLLLTMGSIGDVVGGLQLEGNDLVQMFEEMKAGLAAPLNGMGTAFSASLFGLAGSLVLGFLDLQATQAQNEFYNELEEWLSGLTRLGGPDNIVGSSETPTVPAFLQAMMQQTSDNLERLERSLTRSEDSRGRLDATLADLAQRLGRLGETMREERELMRRLVETQELLAGQLAKPGGAPLLDEASRSHLRNTDQNLARLVDEIARSREEMTRELRSEIKLVARTIAFAAGEPQALRD